MPSQVNRGVILYDQKVPESVGWSAEDSFTFTVSSPPAFLPLHTFTILISYQTGKRPGSSHPRTRLLSNEGVAHILYLMFRISTMTERYLTILTYFKLRSKDEFI